MSNYHSWQGSLGLCDQAFSDDRLDVLDDLANLIFMNKRCRKFPDLVAFSIFCRKDNIRRILSSADIVNQVGVGSIFHVAPQNIPLNFGLSFVHGFISGNSNIVKFPKKYEQSCLLVELAEQVLLNAGLQTRDIFLSFDRHDSLNRDITSKVDAVAVWGGNQTIAEFRLFDRAPYCRLIEFGERQSLALFDASNVLALTAPKLKSLSKSFFYDTLLLDQKACSSPILMVWRGSNHDVRDAKDRFWTVFEEVVKEFGYEPRLDTLISRTVYLLKFLENHPEAILERGWREEFLTVNIDKCSSDLALEELSAGYGLMYQMQLSNFADLKSKCSKIAQTLVVDSDNQGEIVDHIIKSALPGVSRVVEAGHALDFDLYWDGYFVPSLYTRKIRG